MASTVADFTGKPILYFVIEGLGPDTETDGSSKAYRWTTRDADTPFTPTTRFRPFLVDIPRQVETEVDIVTGETKTGGMSFTLVEGTGQTGTTPNSVFLTELFAVRNRTKVGEFVGGTGADSGVMTTTDLTLDVKQVVGGIPLVNQVLALGDERMKITAVAGGGGAGGSDRLTVTREFYGTTARNHYTAANNGDSEVRYRAHYMRTRPVDLFLNFADNVEGDELLVRSFILDYLKLRPDGASWDISLRGTESLLDQEVGDRLWHGWTLLVSGQAGIDGEDSEPPWVREIGEPVVIPVYGRDPFLDGSVGQERPMVLTRNAAANAGFMRVGDSVCEYFLNLLVDNNPLSTNVNITAWGLVGSDILERSSNAERHTKIPVRNILVAAIRDNSYFQPVYPLEPRQPSAHPVDIFLCIAMSTGDNWPAPGDNFTAGDPNWDVLPREFGAGIPSTRFNIPAFVAMRDRLGVSMPNLAIAWDGAFNLKKLMEEQLFGPVGVAVLPDSNGLLRPFRIQERFESDDPTVIGTDDIIPRSERYSWDFENQVTSQKWEIDHAGPEGDPGQILSVILPASRARFAQHMSDRRLTIEARGLTEESGLDVAIERSMFVQRHFLEPPPTITLKLNWQHLFVAVGDLLEVTLATLPNIVDGTRGITSQSMIVTKKRFLLRELVRGGGGGIEVRLFWVGIDSPRMVLWSPSAVVAAGDALSGTTVTVERNAFSDGFARGSVLADDTESFTTGGVGVGDYVVLIDSDGALISDNTPHITAVTATTLTLSADFTSGGGPVARQVGYVVVFAGDAGAASYTTTADWTTEMRKFGAWGEAGADIGSTTLKAHWSD